jgi:hypothetical protein
MTHSVLHDLRQPSGLDDLHKRLLGTLEHTGQAPKRFPLTVGTVAWSYNALLEWIECRKAGREWRPLGDAAKQVVEKMEKKSCVALSRNGR